MGIRAVSVFLQPACASCGVISPDDPESERHSWDEASKFVFQLVILRHYYERSQDIDNSHIFCLYDNITASIGRKPLNW